jgi:single-strand DNA-binding protein
MASVNKVILIGNLGRDPEVRATPGGQTVAKFSIATSQKWKNKQNGQMEEKTDWHNIVAWGRLAELCRDYLTKGRPVYVEGRLQTRSWDDKEGKKQYMTEVVAETLQFLGGRGEGAPAGSTRPAAIAVGQSGPPSGGDDIPSFDESDDIPF